MRQKYLKFLKLFSLVNIILLLLNIFSYFLLTGPGVFRTQAESIAMRQQVKLDAPQCSDGIDNDWDGYIDYPDDPGCSTADDDDETDQPVTPTTPPAEPQSPGGSGSNNPPTQPPVPIQPLPVWLTIDQVNNQPLESLIKNPAGYYQLTDQLLTFQGQTNIIDAIIFIQLNDQPQIIYTTYIDEAGYWQWTTPYLLNLANYQLYVWAINPHDPSITSETRFNFQITSQIILPPTEPIVTTTPPVIPPVTPPIIITYPEIVPEEIYNSSKEFYNLNVRVLNENKQVYPNDKLSVKLNIFKLKPDEAREVKINFVIKDKDDKIILSSEKNLNVSKFLSIIQNFQTSFYLKSGKYKIEVSLNKDNKIFIASDSFQVIERPIFIGGFEFPLTTNELARNLLISFLILFLIFVIFVLLLIYEYHLSRREHHISEEDLSRKDYLDLE